MANVVYNRIIRKLTVAFGDLFNSITLVRYNPDLSEQERFIVPIDYATKELYVMRLQGDPELDKKVQMTLPRMSYEMNGLSYDSSRKQITNTKNFFQNGSTTNAQYAPVPYDFDFSLYLYVRNIEDGNQIIEHILPYFSPDYTIKVNMIPEMGIVKEVPIILKNVDYSVTYEGDRDSDTRMIIWTLNFTVKGFVFGASSNANLIKTSITNIMKDLNTQSHVVFNMNSPGIGDYKLGETVYQGTTLSLSVASGNVYEWTSNGQLTLTNMDGNFLSNKPIIGAESNANYLFGSYSVLSDTPTNYASIIVVPNPITANANGYYVYTTSIQENVATANVLIGTANNQIVHVPTMPIVVGLNLDLMQ